MQTLETGNSFAAARKNSSNAVSVNWRTHDGLARTPQQARMRARQDCAFHSWSSVKARRCPPKYRRSNVESTVERIFDRNKMSKVFAEVRPARNCLRNIGSIGARRAADFFNRRGSELKHQYPSGFQRWLASERECLVGPMALLFCVFPHNGVPVGLYINWAEDAHCPNGTFCVRRGR